MNELKQLKDVHVEAVKKQRDFDKVTARIEKPSLPWPVPVVMLGIMMIGFFLSLTWSEPREIAADREPELTTVYHVYGEGNPYSIWQMWVTRSTDEDVLHEFAAVLQEAKRIQQLPDDAELSRTLRFVYSDGSAVKYEGYYNEEASYLYSVEQERTYRITNTDSYYMIETMDGYSDAKKYAKVLIIALVLYLIANYFVGRNMRDTEDKKKTIPYHSTQWQTVVTVSAFMLIIILALTVPNLHYFVAMLIFVIAMLMNILLERKFGQNGWRMINFALNSCWYSIILMNLFLM